MFTFFTLIVELLFSMHGSLKVFKSVVGFHIFLVWNFRMRHYFHIIMKLRICPILTIALIFLSLLSFFTLFIIKLWWHTFPFNWHLLTLNNDLLSILWPFCLHMKSPWVLMDVLFFHYYRGPIPILEFAILKNRHTDPNVGKI